MSEGEFDGLMKFPPPRGIIEAQPDTSAIAECGELPGIALTLPCN
jgi:hypothetical protein